MARSTRSTNKAFAAAEADPDGRGFGEHKIADKRRERLLMKCVVRDDAPSSHDESLARESALICAAHGERRGDRAGRFRARGNVESAMGDRWCRSPCSLGAALRLPCAGARWPRGRGQRGHEQRRVVRVGSLRARRVVDALARRHVRDSLRPVILQDRRRVDAPASAPDLSVTRVPVGRAMIQVHE
jgi:hypothetical protein